MRTWRNRAKVISGLVFPFLWLVFFGIGVSSNVFVGNFGLGDDFSYMEFLIPGVIAMTVLFSSMFSAISIVNDREFGFLKEVLVSPAARWAVAAGKALGGASTATISGTIMFALIPFLGVTIPFNDLLVLIAAIFLSINSPGIPPAPGDHERAADAWSHLESRGVDLLSWQGKTKKLLL